MNKKQLIIQYIITFLLSIILLLTCFGVTYLSSENEAKNNLKVYANDIALRYEGIEENELITQNFEKIIGFRVTILPIDSNEVVLEINNIDKLPYSEDRLEEFKSNIDKFYYKSSLTLNEDVLYYVTLNNNSNYLIRVGLVRSSIIYNSLLVLIFGSIIVFILLSLYYIYLYKVYKKNFKIVEKEVNKLSLLTNSPNLLNYKIDELKVLSSLIDTTSSLIKENINELNKEKEKIEYIINNIEEGLIILDSNKNIILINNFVVNLLNINISNKKDYINKNISYLFFPSIVDEYLNKLINNKDNNDLNNNDLNNNNNKSLTLELERNNKYYEFLFSIIKNEDDNNYLYSIIINDITNLKNTIKMKKEFFQNSSHELKSPLTSIIAYEEMIDNNLLNSEEEIKEANTSILKNAKRMKELIDNMLYLSNLENNEYKINKASNCSLKEYITSLIKDSYKLKLKNKNIKIELININNEDIVINIEDNDLKMLLSNLIDNAIKYSNNNSKIEIIVDNSTSSLSIIDHGIGIKENEIDSIFNRFKRSDEAIKNVEEGYGLGLAIVKHIIIKYNYKIEVTSKEGEGSQFKIVFK